MKRIARDVGLLLVCVLAFAQPLHAQATDDDESIAKDLHEEVQRIPVTVTDLYGRRETRQIPITIFRPAGDGPHPLAVMNHGRATASKRPHQGRQRYEPLARYLVSKGFAVLVPTRVGYGETFGDFDPEASGDCNSRRIEPMSIAASDQVLATLAFAKTLPFVDTSRWIVLGQSVGGLTSVTTVYRHPPGLVGGINFSGGVGGDPDRSPGHPCRPDMITSLWGAKAAGAKVPMLWLYWETDHYWGAENPKRWHEAYVRGGGQAEMHMLAPAGKPWQDGHGSISFDMDHWVPLAEAFLARLGFNKPGMVRRPPPTAFARVDEVDKVPAKASARETFYRKFLYSKTPRAFAVGASSGSAGWATGDWAMGRAIGYCQRKLGERCKLYAVDDDVVWKP